MKIYAHIDHSDGTYCEIVIAEATDSVRTAARMAHKIAARLMDPIYVYGAVINRMGVAQIAELIKQRR